MSSSTFSEICSQRTTPTSTVVAKFGPKTTVLEVVKGLNVRIDGKVVVITGATSGKKGDVFLSVFSSVAFSFLKDLVLKQLEYWQEPMLVSL